MPLYSRSITRNPNYYSPESSYMTANEAPKTVPKPRRRWFQFSLGSLFVLMTVLCVWLGVTVERARKQREAVAVIRELGGEVFYDYQFDSSDIFVPGVKPPDPKWLRELVGDEYFASVIAVALAAR